MTTTDRAFTDQHFMRRALRLAVLGRHASPNPMVGCVLVSPAGEVVGQGFHPRAGEPHAEIFALREAGDLAKDSTAYVSLEPCAHHGRTPPCADALIKAGVARVVVAMVDPDPRVAGQGIARLRAAGLEVETGVCAEAAAEINAAYLKQRRTGVPYVTVKIAMTLDGKIATSGGDSQWITSPTTRLWVHRQLRDRADAILVGVNTILSDNPALTTRLPSRNTRNPIRVIVDSGLRTPRDSQVARLSGFDGKTWIAHTSSADPARAEKLAQAGVKLIPCATDNNGKVDLADLLAQLGTTGDILSVLVEGGAELVGSLVAGRLVDRYIATIAPKIAGGRDAPGPVGGGGLSAMMADTLPVARWKWRCSGPDLVVDARLA